METGIRITDMVCIAVCYADGVTLLVHNSQHYLLAAMAPAIGVAVVRSRIVAICVVILVTIKGYFSGIALLGLLHQFLHTSPLLFYNMYNNDLRRPLLSLRINFHHPNYPP